MYHESKRRIDKLSQVEKPNVDVATVSRPVSLGGAHMWNAAANLLVILVIRSSDNGSCVL